MYDARVPDLWKKVRGYTSLHRETKYTAPTASYNSKAPVIYLNMPPSSSVVLSSKPQNER